MNDIHTNGSPRKAHDSHSREAASHDLKGRKHRADSERLDEGLEETFPASDPVAAKNIT
jgi:hypothetical protein